MPTVEETARLALGSLNSAGSFLLACQWISDRYIELMSRTRFKARRKVAELVIPATYQTGTVTIVNGSPDVVGVDTVFTIDMEGQFFRSGLVWHEIETFVDPTHLTLLNPFTDTDVADGVYVIVNKRIELPVTVRWLGETMINLHTGQRLTRMNWIELAISDPNRFDAFSDPSVFTEVGINPETGARQIEFYPYPEQAVLVGYAYWEIPAPLAFDDDIPTSIDPYILKEGCMIDIMRFEMAKAAQAGQPDIAGFWRNESRTQETAWEKRVTEAIGTDRGTDDISAILMLGNSGNRQGPLGTI